MAGKKLYMQGTKRSQVVLSLVLAASLVTIGFVLWWFYKNTQVQKTEPFINQNNVSQEPVVEQPELKVDKKDFNSDQIQSIIDGWISSLPQNASTLASVSVSNESGDFLGGFKVDRQYFSASLYKLFVAYEGYRAIDEGKVGPDEPYQNGRTRLQCLDAMIRSSDSPCGEKMMQELETSKLDEAMKAYGLDNTTLTGLKTSSADVAVIMTKIVNGEGLSEDSQLQYLDSLKTQDALYRRGLPSGFSSAVTVYNKVGWNEQLEYHDASIIELADGRKMVVAVLTSGVGSARIADLARRLEAIF
jgi:beta-lactamase class A